MKLIILILLINSYIFSFDIMKEYKAINKEQLSNLQVVYTEAQKYKASDGKKFHLEISGIFAGELSYGTNKDGLIGDRGKETLYYYLHYTNKKEDKDIPKRIFIEKKDTITKDNKRYFLYKGKYEKKVYEIEGDLKPIVKSSLGPLQIQPDTAIHTIKKFKSLKNKYQNLLHNKLLLANKLLYDLKFSTEIAVHYLILHYEIALKKKIKDPRFYCISKYNGGSENYRYYNKTEARIKVINLLILNKKIK